MGDKIRLLVDKELAGECWKLTKEEIARLTESILDEGVRDPVIYWEIPGKPLKECPIIDGHHRYSICCEHDISFPALGMQFDNRDDAIEWILRNQLGRRNASEVQKSRLRAVYLEKKRARTKDSPDGHLMSKVVAMTAKELGVSERQLYRDKRFSAAVEKIAVHSKELAEAAAEGRFTKGDTKVLGGAPRETILAIVEAPEDDWKSCVKAAAQSIRNKKPKKKVGDNGRPLADVKVLEEIDKIAAQLVRAKAAALREFGGKKCGYAFEQAEIIREATNVIFKAKLKWAKEAEKNGFRAV